MLICYRFTARNAPASPLRHNIPCGKALAPRGRYHWSVTVTGADGSTDTAQGEPFYTALPLKAGDAVKLEHTEVLDKAGNFIQNIIGQNKNQTDVFYCARRGERTWQPEFTYHGFRYVRVSGTSDINAEQFTIHVLHTPMDVTGSFRCNDQRLNQLQENILRSQNQQVAAQPKNDPRTDEHLRYIWNNDFQYGDWLMPSAVKSGLVGPAMMQLTGFEAATLMYVYTNMLMERTCRVLGLSAEDYAAVAQKTREAFCIEFANPDGTLKKDFQGLYLLALEMDAIPAHLRGNTVAKLVELIHANGDRLDTGFLSIPFLLPVLSRPGLCSGAHCAGLRLRPDRGGVKL